MSRLGHTTHKYYKETRGIKVSGGQEVKAGTILTRQGHRWKPGINVIGLNHLTAACDGEIYFTKSKSKYNRLVTVINVKASTKAASAKAANKN